MIDSTESFTMLTECRSNVKVFAVCQTYCYQVWNSRCQSHDKFDRPIANQAEYPTRRQWWSESHYQTHLLFQSFWIRAQVRNFSNLRIWILI